MDREGLGYGGVRWREEGEEEEDDDDERKKKDREGKGLVSKQIQQAAMAAGSVRATTIALVVFNLSVYLAVLGLAGWAVNTSIDGNPSQGNYIHTPFLSIQFNSTHFMYSFIHSFINQSPLNSHGIKNQSTIFPDTLVLWINAELRINLPFFPIHLYFELIRN